MSQGALFEARELCAHCGEPMEGVTWSVLAQEFHSRTPGVEPEVIAPAKTLIVCPACAHLFKYKQQRRAP